MKTSSNAPYTPSRRRFLTALGAVAGTGLLAACGSGGADTSGPGSASKPKSGTKASNSAPSARGGTLKVANPAEPNFLDPAQALEISELGPIRNVYEGLVEWDSNYQKIVPALAKSWSSNSDATEWTFDLLTGIKFHDGATFDSKTVEASVKHYMGQVWGSMFDGFKSADTSASSTVTLKFTKPRPDLLRDFAFARMISPKLLKDDGAAKRMVGTGPFKFKEWKKGTSIILEANPDYRVEGVPHFDELQFISIPDAATQVHSLQSGDVDVIMKVDPYNLKELKSNSKFATSSVTAWLNDLFSFRWDMEGTSDVRVRQALAYAIDVDTIVKDVLLGEAKPATSPLPHGVYGWKTPQTQYPHDPKKAMALLKDAGYDADHPLKLPMATEHGLLILGDRVMDAIVGQLKDVNVQATSDSMEAGLFVKELTGKSPKHKIYHYEFGWLDGSLFHFSTGNSLKPYQGATDSQLAKLQALSDEATSTPDGEARLKKIAELQEEYMKELPTYPLFDAVLTDVFQSNIKGYQNPKDGFQPYFGNAYRET